MEENEHMRELTADLDREAAEAGKRRRHAQTSEAARINRLNAKCRREGREPTTEELYGKNWGRRPA